MADRELFRMNEYGDIWQEPELFDQLDTRPEITRILDEAQEAFDAYASGGAL